MEEYNREISSLLDVCRSYIKGGVDLLFVQAKIRLTEDIIYSYENRHCAQFLSKIENQIERIIYTIDDDDQELASKKVCSEIIDYFNNKSAL
ncbi:hypothetical protein AA105894_2161 [Asaia spathodeae NBRC 105894]|nr:hypothetical protein AA105894_2161 [Asaia spathodeae NBRC 105894]